MIPNREELNRRAEAVRSTLASHKPPRQRGAMTREVDVKIHPEALELTDRHLLHDEMSQARSFLEEPEEDSDPLPLVF